MAARYPLAAALVHDERLAPDVERHESSQVHHTVSFRAVLGVLRGVHVEHRKEHFRLWVVWEIPARKVLSDTPAANHVAHAAVLLLEVGGEDSPLGFVPQKFHGAARGNRVDGALFHLIA